MSFSETFGQGDGRAGTKPKGGGGGGGGSPETLIGWDGDLADKAAFIAKTTWDPDFAVGCSQAEAEAAFSVNAGDLEIDTGDAVTAGAAIDFKARWWLTGLVLPQMDIGFRAERIASGLDSSAPFGIIRFCAHHFASDVAVSPSTPTDVSSYFASWIGLEFLSHAANFSMRRGLFTTAPTSTLVANFIRFHASIFRAHQLSGAFVKAIQFESHASNYTSVGAELNNTDGSRTPGQEYTAGRRFRFAIEIDPDSGANMGAGGDEQLELRIPRLRVVVANP